MHLTIYFDSKPLFLSSEITPEIEEYHQRGDTIYIDELSLPSVRTMIQEMENPDYVAGIFLHAELDELLEAFRRELTLVQAAGGLVYTPEKDLLLIFRKGKWDLPKGKLDEGESLEECAVREVEEETGIRNLELEKPLCITYHTYHHKGQHVLKESHWYLMTSPEKQELTPQTEEDIQECIWVSLQDLAPYLDRAHRSVKDVLAKGREMLEV